VDGTRTINYVHRGTAYQLVTDRSGRLFFPNGSFSKRNVGFIEGAGPQVISSDFSSNGLSSGIDWTKVWDARIADGKDVVAGKTAKTGKIMPDLADPLSMYYWEGALQASLSGNILTITGGLNAVKR